MVWLPKRCYSQAAMNHLLFVLSSSKFLFFLASSLSLFLFLFISALRRFIFDNLTVPQSEDLLRQHSANATYLVSHFHDPQSYQFHIRFEEVGEGERTRQKERERGEKKRELSCWVFLSLPPCWSISEDEDLLFKQYSISISNKELHVEGLVRNHEHG